MDVVLYMRYSSSNQTEQSIEGQDRVCTEYCKRKGYNIIGRYIDRATSAYKDIEKRVQFLQMVEDSAKKLFQAVVVYKLDRFARNTYEAATFRHKLKANKVQVISATEEIPDTPESIIMESVLTGLAEYYSKELSQKVIRGMYDTARKGRSIGGRTPYGYMIQDHKYVPDPDTAWVAQEIFHRVANKEKFSSISDDLNKRGILRNGKPWGMHSFGFLKLRMYMGEYTRQGVVIPHAIEPLVTEDIWDSVQTAFRTRQHNKWKATKTNFLLTGKVFCGHCNAPCIGDSGTSKAGKPYYYYSCSNAKKDHSCSKKRIPKEWLEDTVFNLVKESLTAETINTLAEMAYQCCLDALANSQVDYYEKQIEDRDKRIANLFKGLEYGLEMSDIAPRVDVLKRERKELEDQLKYEKSKYFIVEKEQVRVFFKKFLAGEIANIPIKEAVLDALVYKVVVWDGDDGDGTKIQVHLTIGGCSEKVISGSPILKSTNTWFSLAEPAVKNWFVVIEKEYHR